MAGTGGRWSRSGWARCWPSGGAWSAPGQGPFPAGGLIPALKPLYDDNWVVGFAVALVLYRGLTMVAARREPARHASYAGQQG